jgi:hypothetical protein
MKIKPLVKILFFILMLFFTVLILIKFFSLPPACRPNILIFGGCFAKNKIINLKIPYNLPACIKIKANNCQAKFEVINNCGPILVQDQLIQEKYTILNSLTNENSSNIKNQELDLNIEINDQKYQIKYTKTKDYCN